MSVPLPSPSPLTPASAKPIPRSRPQPISTLPSSPDAHSPRRTPVFSPSSPGSPRSASFRKPGTARSVGFNTGGGESDNWRDRVSAKSAVRTVGGFEKSPKIGVVSGKEREKEREKEAEGDSKTAALSHVPCRFYKAGACTAGATCPFSHEEGGKKEICQWFLKGSCKFGHKCALAHVRPGEPMSMDRKNKKAAQLEARERDGRSPIKPDSPHAYGGSDPIATPVPIKSALSSSIQSPPAQRLPSSPLREPLGPPPGGIGSSSPGFTRSPGPGGFASSPSRPSPLSGSFGARAVSGGPSLKSSTLSPLRPPSTAFSSSFSHSVIQNPRPGTSPAPPLSASFADGTRKNIWARRESPMDQPEVLSPRRPIHHRPRLSTEDVFADDDDNHGEDLLPSSLSDLLTPRERARRMSRRDSQESFSASPSRGAFGQQAYWTGGERLAQSAGPTMGPGFLQGLWSAEGEDVRKASSPQNGEFTFGPSTAQTPQKRQSLLTQQRSPTSPQRGTTIHSPIVDVEPPSPYIIRALGDPSSPSAKALQEHAPGQSLPGGVATALSRLHLHGPRMSSGLAQTRREEEEKGVEGLGGESDVGAAGEEHEEEGVFAMDG